MKTILLLILLLVGLTGCVKSETEHNAVNQINAANPKKVCTLPDGRVLYRITVENPNYNHYVYFFSTNDTTTVSVNYAVPQGKTSRNQTIVLDGETYQLVPQK